MVKAQKWPAAVIELADWALRSLDLQYRFMLSKSASTIMSTCGVIHCFEKTVVLEVYAGALAKGFVDEETIYYEKPYPATHGNRKWADLAFKDEGKGKKWGYVEVKYYGYEDKGKVEKDIRKLRTIKQKSQRWMFIYRVRNEGSGKSLSELLKKNFVEELEVSDDLSRSFSTRTNYDLAGTCEMCLCRVRSQK